jgi:hypothetical protein
MDVIHSLKATIWSGGVVELDGVTRYGHVLLEIDVFIPVKVHLSVIGDFENFVANSDCSSANVGEKLLVGGANMDVESLTLGSVWSTREDEIALSVIVKLVTSPSLKMRIPECTRFSGTFTPNNIGDGSRPLKLDSKLLHIDTVYTPAVETIVTNDGRTSKFDDAIIEESKSGANVFINIQKVEVLEVDFLGEGESNGPSETAIVSDACRSLGSNNDRFAKKVR